MIFVAPALTVARLRRLAMGFSLFAAFGGLGPGYHGAHCQQNSELANVWTGNGDRSVYKIAQEFKNLE